MTPEEERRWERKSDVSETRAHVGAWVLLVGLILEVALTFDLPEMTAPYMKWTHRVAAFMVAIGVYGEVKFARVAARYDDRIKNGLRDKLNEATAEAGKANEAAAIANQKAAEAVLRLERERGERLKYEAAFAWRRIEAAQSARLVALLSVRPSDVHIAHLVSDRETFSFALHLKDVFEKAGWQILWATDGYVVPPFGLIVPPGADMEATKMVQSAFSEVGIEFDPNDPGPTNMRLGAGRTGAVRMVIGHRMTPDMHTAYGMLLADK